MKAIKRILLVVVISGIALGVAFYRSVKNCELVEASGTAANEGCINQGTDCREFSTVICWAQRHLSWKSEHPPHFLLLGKPKGTSLGLAWPPYVVFNSPDGTGRWRMFRIGFRYDRTWRGYIFPTVAAKYLPKPLRY